MHLITIHQEQEFDVHPPGCSRSVECESLFDKERYNVCELYAFQKGTMIDVAHGSRTNPPTTGALLREKREPLGK
jgi:hypothetical protein